MLAPLSINSNKSCLSFSGHNALAKLTKKTPASLRYGIDYQKGDVGFTFDKKSWISSGIAYFTRWQRKSDIKIDHAFIVIDDSTCIEALSETGVATKKIQDYFNNKDTTIFFRKLKESSLDIADKITQNAKNELGKKYANFLLLVGIERGSFLGHFIDKITNGSFFDKQAQLMNQGKSFLCSSLVAHCLQKAQQWPYHDKGILKRPAPGITPQELFEDETIFMPGRIEIQRSESQKSL